MQLKRLMELTRKLEQDAENLQGEAEEKREKATKNRKTPAVNHLENPLPKIEPWGLNELKRKMDDETLKVFLEHNNFKPFKNLKEVFTPHLLERLAEIETRIEVLKALKEYNKSLIDDVIHILPDAKESDRQDLQGQSAGLIEVRTLITNELLLLESCRESISKITDRGALQQPKAAAAADEPPASSGAFFKTVKQQEKGSPEVSAVGNAQQQQDQAKAFLAAVQAKFGK
ncbi:MAG: hypothetical protein K0Q74_1195 [Gammaproteobacteria bacterium]|nr:hypothetical protein [Gammaproteobacteria bacterium]